MGPGGSLIQPLRRSESGSMVDFDSAWLNDLPPAFNNSCRRFPARKGKEECWLLGLGLVYLGARSLRDTA